MFLIVMSVNEIFISACSLKTLQQSLQAGQRFVTSGGFDGELQNKAMFVCMNTSPKRDNSLECNPEEADTRMWLHTVNFAGTKKLILSPDTDVCYIGLPIVAASNIDVLVRLSNSVEHRILVMQL